eukprot:1950650-Pleurochrysis_carterae.AAC.3
MPGECAEPSRAERGSADCEACGSSRLSALARSPRHRFAARSSARKHALQTCPSNVPFKRALQACPSSVPFKRGLQTCPSIVPLVGVRACTDHSECAPCARSSAHDLAPLRVLRLRRSRLLCALSRAAVAQTKVFDNVQKQIDSQLDALSPKELNRRKRDDYDAFLRTCATHAQSPAPAHARARAHLSTEAPPSSPAAGYETLVAEVISDPPSQALRPAHTTRALAAFLRLVFILFV